MKPLTPEMVPSELRERPQWVLWKLVERDGKVTKVPFAVDGSMAKSNDSSTWSDFRTAWKAFLAGGYTGVGFMFSEADPFVGIDLDSCRDPKTGTVAPWAKTIIQRFGSYAEMSPSMTGVKIFAIGKSPFPGGRKVDVAEAEQIGDKRPAIEVYDRLRYFAVTGWRMKGPFDELRDATEPMAELAAKYFQKAPEFTPGEGMADYYSETQVEERARRYLAKMPGAVSGASGHNTTFKAACILILGFGLSEGTSFGLLAEWNAGCSPPWTEHELRHKIASASKAGGTRNYLRNIPLEKQQSVSLPEYREPPRAASPAEVKLPSVVELKDGAAQYLDSLDDGSPDLVTTGVPGLDDALGGGIMLGEMVVFAARPGHGKTAVALQCGHHWTLIGHPVLMISQEMTIKALGKRLLQFLSPMYEHQWKENTAELRDDLKKHSDKRQPFYIAQSVSNSTSAVALIEKMVSEKAVKCIIVDYAQILKGVGKTRYEEITQTSEALRIIATKCNIVMLAVCQLGRQIEQREHFIPKLSDIKESGAFEQDADIIVFPLWPKKLDDKQPPEKFQFIIGKNRNRGVHQFSVECKFEPWRQRLLAADQADDAVPIGAENESPDNHPEIGLF